MKNLLTVCVPMYNSELTIKKCIESIIESSVPVEIIIVDDFSTDNSYTIAETLCKYNIKLVTNKYEKGPGGARNTGIDLCETEYITFCDADDFIPRHAYEKLLRTAILNSSDLVIGLYLRKINNSKWNINNEIKDKYKSINYNHFGDEQLIQITPSVCNKIFKYKIIKDNNISFKNSYLSEDLEFTTHFFSHSKTINLIDEIVYCYHTYTSKKNIISNITPEIFKQGLVCIEHTLTYMKRMDEKNFSFVLNGSIRFLFNKIFTSSLLYSFIMLKEIKLFIDKYKKLCNPFLFYSVFKIDIKKFFKIDVIDYYILLKKCSINHIREEIESVISKENIYKNIDYVDIYLKILIKCNFYLKVIDFFYEYSNIENKELKFTILNNINEMYKKHNLWNNANKVCKQMIKIKNDINVWYEFALSLKECSKYEYSYKILIDNVNYNKKEYWQLRSELAEFLNNIDDAIFSWKMYARCADAQFSIALENIKRISLSLNKN